MMKNKGGFLLFVSLTEFFSDILKKNSDGEFDFKLGDCYILVLSRDITTDVVKSSGQVNDFQSKYANVEFINNLLPSVAMMEYATTSGMDTFVDMYVERLGDASKMRDIISICDIVAKRGVPVFVLVSSMDLRTQYPIILRDFILSEFGLQGYLMEDLKGKDISDVVYDIGNRDKIIAAIDEHLDLYLRMTDKEYFLNTLIDDVEKVYRDALNSKPVDELKELAKVKMIFISRRDDKARIIDKLINSIMSEES